MSRRSEGAQTRDRPSVAVWAPRSRPEGGDRGRHPGRDARCNDEESHASLLLSRRDLDFLLFEWLNVEQLTKRDRYRDHCGDTFRAVLELSERVAIERFDPHDKTNDANEPVFDGQHVHVIPEVIAALDNFAGTGMAGGSMDYEIGGMQLPSVITSACFAWFQAANIGTSSYRFLTVANANLLLAHATPEQIETYVKPMIEGRFYGNDVPVRTTCGLLARRRDHPGRPERRWHPPALREQDVGSPRRSRVVGEHRPPCRRTSSTSCSPRSRAVPPTSKASHCSSSPKVLVSSATTSSWPAQPQEGVPRHHKHPAQLR